MRRMLVIVVFIAITASGYFAWKAEQPIPRTPSANWEASISSGDFLATTFQVMVEGADLEAMLLLPNSLDVPSGAVVFGGGSSDGLFQDYAPGFLKSYLQDIFLPRGIAVVYVNKRGMGDRHCGVVGQRGPRCQPQLAIGPRRGTIEGQ